MPRAIVMDVSKSGSTMRLVIRDTYSGTLEIQSMLRR